MKLTFMERSMLIGILPGEGDILYLRTRKELIDKLAFTGEEIEKYVTVDPATGQGKWIPSDEQNVDVMFTNVESGIITDTLKKLNKDRQLKEQHVSLYEKFVDGKET
jgi:hypothetical protein